MTNTEKEALERRIDELCAEVERLHADQWGDGFNAGCDAANAALEESVEHYRTESAKLRELVADMWSFVEGAMDDEYCPDPECPFTELCTENQVCMASSGFHYRMRELGVEVD